MIMSPRQFFYRHRKVVDVLAIVLGVFSTVQALYIWHITHDYSALMYVPFYIGLLIWGLIGLRRDHGFIVTFLLEPDTWRWPHWKTRPHGWDARLFLVSIKYRVPDRP